MTNSVADKLEYTRGLLQHYEIRLAEELRMYRRTGLSTHHEGVFQLRKIIHDVEKRIKELEGALKLAEHDISYAFDRLGIPKEKSSVLPVIRAALEGKG